MRFGREAATAYVVLRFDDSEDPTAAAKLHLVFESMSRTRGVYLFDEFDALGAERGLRNDVGEIRRVLNSFLQFLERDESESIIIAATTSSAC